MTRFDGVALLGLDDRTEVVRHHHAAELRRQADDRLVRLPDGGLARVSHPIALPATLRCDPGSASVEVVVLGLREPGSAAGAAAPTWALGTTAAALPPVRVHDLIAVEPLPGGRVHATRWGDRTVACGRLPVQGPTRPPAAIDCDRCRDRGPLGERLAAQREAFGDLVALAGPLTAAAAARWWWRTDHLDPRTFPAVLDSAVGAVVHVLPGAPEPEALLDRLADHAANLSASARSWAVATIRERVAAGDTHAIRLLSRLLPAPEAGELLLDVLAERPGDREVEALLWDAALRAGTNGSPRLQRWRRVQAVAAALAS